MRRTLLSILILAFGLRLVAIDHGLPHRYVPDTHSIRGALGMAKTKDLAPPAGQYTSYPYLMPYVLLPEFAALYLGGRAFGVYASAADFGDKMIDDPTPIYLIARTVAMLFGVFGVWLAWRIAKRIGGRRAAWIAAYLVATSFLLVHLGKSARPWVPLTTLVLLCGDRSLAWSRKPTTGRAAWMGITAGLAIACHQAGALAVLLPASAVLSRLGGGLGRAAGAAALSAAMFGVTALLVGFPYLLKGRSADVGVNDEMTEESAVNLGGQSLAFEAFGTDRFVDTALGFVTAEPAILAFLLLGLLLGRPKLRHRRDLVVVGLYPLAGLLIFLFYEGTHVRYLSPAVPFLAILAAVAGRRLFKRTPTAVLASLVLLVPLVQVLRLDFVMLRQDTRTGFLEVVAEHVPAGTRIAVEGYGPPLRISAEGATRLLDDGKWISRAQEREAAGEAPDDPTRPLYDLVPIERYYEFASVWPHQYGDPGDPDRKVKSIEDFLDEREIRWLVAVDRNPGGPRNSAFDEVLARRGTVIADLPPYHGDVGPGEARLPMDPERPLFALWGVSRPGPRLTLWKIDPP